MARTSDGGMQVTFFVQLVPEFYEGVRADGTRTVFDAKAVKMTQRQPTHPEPGAVVVPVTLDVDPAIFGPAKRILAQVLGLPDGIKIVGDS
jgi:hypothetical protein